MQIVNKTQLTNEQMAEATWDTNDVKEIDSGIQVNGVNGLYKSQGDKARPATVGVSLGVEEPVFLYIENGTYNGTLQIMEAEEWQKKFVEQHEKIAKEYIKAWKKSTDRKEQKVLISGMENMQKCNIHEIKAHVIDGKIYYVDYTIDNVFNMLSDDSKLAIETIIEDNLNAIEERAGGIK